MNNIDIKHAIIELKHTAEADKYGGTKRYIQQMLFDQDLIDFMPRSTSLGDPIPANWCAAQITLFDNGEQKQVRKRSYIERTKVRYGGNLKFWVRHGSERIDFKRPSQIEWQASFYLWPANIAAKVAGEMLDAKLIDAQTVEDMDRALATVGDGAWLAVPRRTTAEGSIWPNSHIVIMYQDQSGAFTSGGIFHRGHNGGASMIEINGFTDQLHNGNRLGGKAMAMARIARSNDFEGWATDLQLD